MKICAVICEYNPFHNGHKYQLERVRAESGCDTILCLMSGNFTQRGDAAVFGKFRRAAHAISGGADAVLELPADFAVAPAEIFAQGAVRILASVPDVTTLAFGCESGTKEEFLAAAKATLSEDKQFKAALKENLKGGVSYAQARTRTALQFNQEIDEALLTSPNNILGVEYCRALLACGSTIQPMPLLRKGGGYSDTSVLNNFSSATALRACMKEKTRKSKKALKNNLPPDVYRDALAFAPNAYEQAAMCALARVSADTLSRTLDCTEGLENRFKAMSKSNPEYGAMLAKMVSKRYTLSRLKRIVAANFLGIREREVRDSLAAPLYYKVLAVKKSRAEEIFASLNAGAFPLLVRKSDAASLRKETLVCFERDVLANDLYNILTGEQVNEYQTVFVE